MELAKHCELCDHRVFDLSTGTTCGLTSMRPDFKGKCPNIKFGDNHIRRIREVNIEHYRVASKKWMNVAHFILYFMIGVTIMLGGYFLGSMAWDKGVVSKVPLIIIGVGFLIIPFATGPLISFRQDFQIEKKRKMKMDQLLKSYNIEYDSEIIVDEDVHGNKDYNAKISFSRLHYK
ncbi:hypothetical protein PBT90_18400 [Algoriphagus halophytocola]|uniref:Uncharacterized protein n=1 Tax=Algoriphagus halophytocola TaxID=2991499 RepID=A0ABY6MH08_9BACT|nr:MULTISPECIES: hypothetical protein [unclassified Algoriphagus]UZD21489.1 hypothetical protein OM944_12530 [Algoriphagus sp. TR-M5]WBL42701.1 hypothetical protein PBT90_18400 [Algoriphagus sp. TR-M9]